MNFKSLYHLKAATKCSSVIKRSAEDRKKDIKDQARELFDFIIFDTLIENMDSITEIVFKERLSSEFQEFLQVFKQYIESLYEIIEIDIQKRQERQNQIVDYYELYPDKLEEKVGDSQIKSAIEMIPLEFSLLNQRQYANERFNELFKYKNMKSFFDERGMGLKPKDFELMLKKILGEVAIIKLRFVLHKKGESESLQ